MLKISAPKVRLFSLAKESECINYNQLCMLTSDFTLMPLLGFCMF